MKTLFALALAVLLTACAMPPEPKTIKYVALDMPKAVPATEQGEKLQAHRGRFGILWRAPQDIEGMLRELNAQAPQASVIKNADVNLNIPFCLVVLCMGGDFAEGYAPKSTAPTGLNTNPANKLP